MKPAKCPFYPDSCTVEFHPNMQHVWRVYGSKLKSVKAVAEIVSEINKHATNPIVSVDLVYTSKRSKGTLTDLVRNSRQDRQYNARQKLLMAGKRAKRGG